MSEPQMRSFEVLPGYRLPMPNGAFLTAGERLILDQSAKLVRGCTVAVFLGGKFATVGRIVRRPVPSRHLVIECRDVNGNKRIERMWGLKDKDVQIWRVTESTHPCRSQTQMRLTRKPKLRDRRRIRGIRGNVSWTSALKGRSSPRSLAVFSLVK